MEETAIVDRSTKYQAGNLSPFLRILYVSSGRNDLYSFIGSFPFKVCQTILWTWSEQFLYIRLHIFKMVDVGSFDSCVERISPLIITQLNIIICCCCCYYPCTMCWFHYVTSCLLVILRIFFAVSSIIQIQRNCRLVCQHWRSMIRNHSSSSHFGMSKISANSGGSRICVQLFRSQFKCEQW